MHYFNLSLISLMLCWLLAGYSNATNGNNQDSAKIWQVEVLLLVPPAIEASRELWPTNHSGAHPDKVCAAIFYPESKPERYELSRLIDEHSAVACAENDYSLLLAKEALSTTKFRIVGHFGWCQYIHKNTPGIAIPTTSTLSGYGNLKLQPVGNLIQADFQFALESASLPACNLKKVFRIKPKESYYVDHPRLAFIITVAPTESAWLEELAE